MRVRGADRHRAGVLRRPGPARAHRAAAAPRRVAVADRAGALQPDRRAHRDDEQAGHRRPERGRGRGRRRASPSPPTCGSWPTPPAINLAFAGIALSCDSGSSWTLPRLVGTARAKELLLMPRTVARRGGPGARPGDPGGPRRRAGRRRRRARRHAGGRPDAGLRLDPPCGGLLGRAHPERVPGARGRVHGAHRRQRGPRSGRRRLPRQGAARSSPAAEPRRGQGGESDHGVSVSSTTVHASTRRRGRG